MVKERWLVVTNASSLAALSGVISFNHTRIVIFMDWLAG
jgi:hypothetical protein